MIGEGASDSKNIMHHKCLVCSKIVLIFFCCDKIIDAKVSEINGILKLVENVYMLSCVICIASSIYMSPGLIINSLQGIVSIFDKKKCTMPWLNHYSSNVIYKHKVSQVLISSI